jgi:hypothetical protein
VSLMRGSCEPVPEVIPIGKGPNSIRLDTRGRLCLDYSSVSIVRMRIETS